VRATRTVTTLLVLGYVSVKMQINVAQTVIFPIHAEQKMSIVLMEAHVKQLVILLTKLLGNVAVGKDSKEHTVTH